MRDLDVRLDAGHDYDCPRSFAMRCRVNGLAVYFAAIAATIVVEAAEPVVLHERLDRGLVARTVADGKVYLGWRLLRSDPADVAFDVFRRVGDAEAVKLNQSVSPPGNPGIVLGGKSISPAVVLGARTGVA